MAGGLTHVVSEARGKGGGGARGDKTGFEDPYPLPPPSARSARERVCRLQLPARTTCRRCHHILHRPFLSQPTRSTLLQQNRISVAQKSPDICDAFIMNDEPFRFASGSGSALLGRPSTLTSSRLCVQRPSDRA